MAKSNAHRVSVTLSPEQDARLEASVRAGEYPGKSEVLLEGLRLWEEKNLLDVFDTEILREAYFADMNSGDPVYCLSRTCWISSRLQNMAKRLHRFSPKAAQDLHEIWSHIAFHHEHAADALIKRIQIKVERASVFPRMGSPRPDISDQLRILVE